MASPHLLKALVVFRNGLFKELFRSVHVYGLQNSAGERVVEREFLLDDKTLGCQEMICPGRLFTLQRFDVFQHYPGLKNGIWTCILVFHGGVNHILIPQELSFFWYPKLALVPNLARDLETIYRSIPCEDVIENTRAKASGSRFNGDAGQPSSRGTRKVPFLDLNALPSEAEDEETDAMVTGTKERKYKRAATKDIANISLEELTKYFDVPIVEASKALNVGLTVLKKKCREFGIPRWPHRKIKSLGTLIHDLQGELEKQQVEDEIAAIAVAKRQKLIESEKESIEKTPALDIQHETKKFRQDIFKRKHRARVHEVRSQTLPLFWH